MANQNLQHAIGIDLGGTKIELGVVDDKGSILQRIRLETDVKGGANAIEAQLIQGIHSLQEKSGVAVQGIGIGVAGQIHPHTGTVIFAPNLKWDNFPLREKIEKALHLPVQVINDVRAITWGEWLYGAGRGYDDCLCVFIGTGIGSGIISGGLMLTGHTNTLGEVGHMTVDFNGPLCTCGNKGCLEAFAGGWGIAERARDAIKGDPKGLASQQLLALAGGELHGVTAKLVVEAYREANPLAQQTIHLAETALSAGCASMINAFNPQRLIIGGGFIDGFPEMVECIDRGVRRLALKAAVKDLEVVKAQLGKEVGVLGSAAVVFNLLKQEEGVIE